MRYLALTDGLRQPQSSRANEDEDPVAARRAAPPGGNLETSRPGVGRPRLLRAAAADAFRRDAPPQPGPPRSIVARDHERLAAADQHAAGPDTASSSHLKFKPSQLR